MSRIKNPAKFLAAAILWAASPALAAEPGTVYSDVWSALKSDLYQALPQHRTTLSSFFDRGVNVLGQNAQRTLNSDADLLPRFQKLVHPIGICFSGTWTITEDSPYTGYFQKNSQGRIIVRASEAMGNPRVGDFRSFGLAGKIYPTANPSDPRAYKTANFFTIDDLGGTADRSFLASPKRNQPKTSAHLSSLFLLSTITTIASTFSNADANPGIRQVYPISQLGVAVGQPVVTPHWMILQPENTERVGAADFRNELRLGNYPQGLRFGILVAEQGGDGWQRLGAINLTDEALSDSCDHRLHFAHPKSR